MINDISCFKLVEEVSYPNGGKSFFYELDDTAIIIDEDICNKQDTIFSYSLITDKQNNYVNKYQKVYRCLKEDINELIELINDDTLTNSETIKSLDRSDYLDASPLEMKFEDTFSSCYGNDSLKYLQKEYCVSDGDNNYFIDYYLESDEDKYGIEENGVSYHHPQIIGKERYRTQLNKQNICTKWGIKLYRFSSEDCVFKERLADDIVNYFGNDTSEFKENGIVAKRPFKLYEHQELTLEEIAKERAKGTKSFLAVFPTASGKSKIVEEDIKRYSKNKNINVLIIAPNTSITDDWNRRIKENLNELKDNIYVKTYSYIERHYNEYKKDYFNYIVVDEAHHAVSPVLKRTIQYFEPDFLIGLTATDQRMDAKKLESVFGNYKTSLTLQEAMEKEIIAKANVYRIETNIDLSEVRFNGKDYYNSDLETKIRVTSRNQLIVDTLKKYFNDDGLENKQGVIFCVNRNHAKEMEKLLNEQGLSAKAYIGGESDADKIMEQFQEKKIRFLCACNKISEGWDYPELGILVMARPTMSKVLYLQQIGRGLRRTNTKNNVFVIDVVDEYGAMMKPCSMHSIFANPIYVPFGEITKRDYKEGEFVIVDGLSERIERIVEVDINTFEDKYGDYLNQEQLARELYMSTGSIISWIKKGRIKPDSQFSFGSRKIYLFSPDNISNIRTINNIPYHNDETIKEDFFNFLEERDYTLSYKMPFILGLISNLNDIGEADIDKVLDYYINFYKERIEKGLPVDRSSCPYNSETLKDRKYIKSSMLTNPFEKFERKRFMYYSKDLNVISVNHALFNKLTKEDYQRINKQILDDIEDYYKKL